MDPRRAAWRRKHAREPAPWRGPVHAAPLLADLRGRVVELGAGGGKVGRALPGSVALDWAPEGLRDGRAAIVADARALPLRAVDALVAIHVLDHFEPAERAPALAEWARALRPGGTLVLEVFAEGDARPSREADGIATHVFAREELAALLAGWDARIVEEERRLRWGTRRVLRARASPTPA